MYEQKYKETTEKWNIYTEFHNICLNENKSFFIWNSEGDFMSWWWWKILKYDLKLNKWFLAKEEMDNWSWIPEYYVSKNNGYIIYKWIIWAALMSNEIFFKYDINENIVEKIYIENYFWFENNEEAKKYYEKYNTYYPLRRCSELKWFDNSLIENKCKSIIKDYFNYIWKHDFKNAYDLKYNPSMSLDKFIETYKDVNIVEIKDILLNDWEKQFKVFINIDWINYESIFTIFWSQLITKSVKVIN